MTLSLDVGTLDMGTLDIGALDIDTLDIDKGSATPVYVQLTEQIHLLIHRGELPPGSAMPTVRSLAVELGINANTVARVYRELQSEGFLRLERGVGTFVAEGPREQIAAREFETIAGKARQLVTVSRRAGLSSRELVQLIEKLWKESKP